jgi:hypothetical protein
MPGILERLASPGGSCDGSTLDGYARSWALRQSAEGVAAARASIGKDVLVTTQRVLARNGLQESPMYLNTWKALGRWMCGQMAVDRGGA